MLFTAEVLHCGRNAEPEEASKTRSTGSRWRSLPFRVTAPPAQRAAFRPNEHPSEYQWARAGGQDQGGYKVSTALLTSPAGRDRLSLLSPCTKDFPWVAGQPVVISVIE